MCVPQYVNRVINPRCHDSTPASTLPLKLPPCLATFVASHSPFEKNRSWQRGNVLMSPLAVTSAALGYLLPPGHDAAVDGQDDAGDPVRLIRGEKQQGLGSVFRLAVAAEGMHRVEGWEHLRDLLIR